MYALQRCLRGALVGWVWRREGGFIFDLEWAQDEGVYLDGREGTKQWIFYILELSWIRCEWILRSWGWWVICEFEIFLSCDWVVIGNVPCGFPSWISLLSVCVWLDESLGPLLTKLTDCYDVDSVWTQRSAFVFYHLFQDMTLYSVADISFAWIARF